MTRACAASTGAPDAQLRLLIALGRSNMFSTLYAASLVRPGAETAVRSSVVSARMPSMPTSISDRSAYRAPAMLSPDSGAGLLHRLTSYTPSASGTCPVDDPRVRHDLDAQRPGDRAAVVRRTTPPTCRASRCRETCRPPTSRRRRCSRASRRRRRLDAAGLGRVLFLGAGVVRFVQRGERRIIFRASGSAGARFPLEVYACTRGVDGVPDGVHWYDGSGHALVRSLPRRRRRRCGHPRRDRRPLAHRLALRRARAGATSTGTPARSSPSSRRPPPARASIRGCAPCSPTPGSATWSAPTACTRCRSPC